MDKTSSELMLPGFRFHPTEEELVDFYLRKMVFGNKLRFNIIGLLNIYHYDPWDLPGLSKIGEREWYFFVPRDRRHGHGGRPNRTTANGFWKATGSDRRIISISNPKRVLGLKKTLVFYTGRAPRGCKTDWVMNEYRMPDTCSLPKEDIVLCKIYRKATSLKVLEQRAAMEEEMKTSQEVSSSSPTIEPVSKYEQADNLDKPMPLNDIILKTEVEEEEEEEEEKEEKGEEKKEKKEGKEASSWSLRCQRATNLPELQLPKLGNDWAQDAFWTQLNSPWLDNWSPYMNVLNF